uniref:Uncharacterized protein n=1 Tax=Cacopsylla melanoneura TaxID=428564 RepID=A0A8D9FFC2_9HEMI
MVDPIWAPHQGLGANICLLTMLMYNMSSQQQEQDWIGNHHHLHPHLHRHIRFTPEIAIGIKPAVPNHPGAATSHHPRVTTRLPVNTNSKAPTLGSEKNEKKNN